VQGVELRMYSLGLLVVTLCFIFSMKTAKEQRISNFIWLTVTASLCAYTHYFAIVSGLIAKIGG